MHSARTPSRSDPRETPSDDREVLLDRQARTGTERSSRDHALDSLQHHVGLRLPADSLEHRSVLGPHRCHAVILGPANADIVAVHGKKI